MFLHKNRDIYLVDIIHVLCIIWKQEKKDVNIYVINYLNNKIFPYNMTLKDECTTKLGLTYGEEDFVFDTLHFWPTSFPFGSWNHTWFLGFLFLHQFVFPVGILSSFWFLSFNFLALMIFFCRSNMLHFFLPLFLQLFLFPFDTF